MHGTQDAGSLRIRRPSAEWVLATPTTGNDAPDDRTLTNVAAWVGRRLERAGWSFEPGGELLRLPEPMRVLYALVVADGEIGNGGLLQLYVNPAGSLVHEAIRGAALVGAVEAEAILRRSLDLFPGGEPIADREERIAFIEALPATQLAFLDELDARWYALSRDGDDVEAHGTRYIRAHADAFFEDVS